MNGALSALRAQLSEAEAHTKTAREQQRVMAESKVRAEMMRERLLLTFSEVYCSTSTLS
jgi:hypothetical protein